MNKRGRPQLSNTELVEFDVVKKTRYEWKQAQRRPETKVRQEKDISIIAKAAGDNDRARQANEKIEIFRAKYDELCEKTGLQPTLERMAVNDKKLLTGGGSGGIIKEIKTYDEVADVHYVGKIDKNIYKCITEDIKTDDVIITDERIQHIKERHPDDYERYYQYIKDIIIKPDYIIEANKPHSALLLKAFRDKNEEFKTILRLVTSSDNPEFKNSIITFMKIDEKEWNRLKKNKKILYKSE